MQMDPVSATLIGYGLSKTLDGLFAVGGQGRALRSALGRALARFRDHYPDVIDLILADEAWELFQDELKLLVTPNQHPDATRLAERLAKGDAGKAQRLQPSLSELFHWVRSEAALEPKLAAMQVFRLEEQVLDRLAGIEQALGIGLDVTDVLARARQASRADIEAFRAARNLRDYEAQLELRYSIRDGTRVDIGLNDIVQLVCAGQRVLLEGQPGFGKSTTTLRLADRLVHEDDDVCPLFVPLAEWAVGRRDLFEEIACRAPFSGRTLSARHIQFLAETRRIILLLDGWNELSGQKLEWAHSELRKFLREHPSVGVVVTMRPTVQRPPLNCPLALTIPALDGTQRDAVIRARLGEGAEEVIDRIRRQRDLDELTRIPLYLSTYLRVTTADFAPRSKEELLRAFVRSHETSGEHELPLREALRGFHDEFLQDLAVRMLTGGGPALSGGEARQVASSTGDRLVQARQIGAKPDPSDVLSTLVAHHLFVATGERDELAYSFQHQQFQEWFASCHVEAVILRAADVGGGDPMGQLRTEIIDRPIWEEPVLFAVERLVGKGATGEAAAASLLELALQVDPMLAASMIFRCSDGVWGRVRDVVIDFAGRWHRDGTVDRALGFMIATGRSEFSEVIWPYIGHHDMQIRLRTLRKADPFRPGVLGEDWLARFKGLSEEAQKNFLVEVVIDGGVEGIALAVEAVAGDLPDSLKIEVIEALQFRHAFTQMNRLLANASDDVWRELAWRGRLDRIDDNLVRRRIIEEKRRLALSVPHGVGRARIHLGLVQLGVEEAKPELSEEIGHPSFELDKDYTFPILEAAAAIDAPGVSAALIGRMIEGASLGSHVSSFLHDATEEQKSEILDRILDGRIDQRRFDEAASLLGQEQIANLVDRFLDTAAAIAQAPRQVSEDLREQYWKWQKAIAPTNLSALLDILLARELVTTVWEINALADLLIRHEGRYDANTRLEIPDRQKSGVWEMLDRWVDLLIGSPAGIRYVMSSVASVLERIGAQETLATLVRLLDVELAQKNADDNAFRAWIEGGQKGPQPKEARMGTAFSYRRAFEAIPGTPAAQAVLRYLDDADFGPEAAQILRHVGLREAGLLEEGVRFSRWPDYSRIKKRHQLRSGQTTRPDPHPYATAILDAVKRVVRDEPDQKDLARAVRLCIAASGLEYGDRLPEILEVLERSDAHRAKIGCFLNLILAGENVPADLIEPGCEAAFQKWHEQRWHQENDWWQLEDWLVIQALSDDPERLLRRVESLEETFRRPWKYEGIVRALGASPHVQAAGVLVRLGEMIPDLKVSHTWIKAAAERDEVAVTDVLMDMLWDAATSARLLQSRTDRVFSSALATRIRDHEGSKRTLKERLRETLAEPVRVLSLEVVEHLGDEELVLAALNQISDTRSDYAPYHLRQAIENIVTSRVPIEDWPSAYNIVPANASRLRASLFRMAYDDPDRWRTARTLLEWTDELRDEYGRPDDERRHPDIGSGRQWPILR